MEKYIEKELIPYTESLILKELGFSISCYERYHNGELEVDYGNWNGHSIEHIVSAPLYQQAFRWFREKYNLFGCIDLQVCTPTHWFIRIDNMIENDYVYHSEDENLRYKTHEEAQLECLRKLIEIVKEK